MKEITTIKISKAAVLSLAKLKIHPRQSYEEVIVNLLAVKKSKKESVKEHQVRDITTIKISKSTVEKLTLLKIHPRQSYEEVIVNLLSCIKDNK